MNRRIETALRSKYNFRKSVNYESNERVVCSKLLRLDKFSIGMQQAAYGNERWKKSRTRVCVK